MEDTIALIKAISYIVWPICLLLIVFIFRKEIRTVLLSFVQKKANENKPVVDRLSDTSKLVTEPEEPEEPRGHQPAVALPPEDQLSVKVCKNNSGDYFVVLDDEENDEKIYCITPQGIPKWIERRILQTIEYVNVDMLGEEQLKKFYKFIENAEPDAAEVGIIRKPLIAYYLPSYMRMVNNLNTLPAKMLAYIKSKGRVTWREVKQYLHDTYGYSRTSGSMDASLKALETLGLVTITGQGDDKIITYVGPNR